jgi:hypothetical protein
MIQDVFLLVYDFFEMSSNNGLTARNIGGIHDIGDGLLNIAISYAQVSDSYSVEEIAEGFVSKTLSDTPVLSTLGMY